MQPQRHHQYRPPTNPPGPPSSGGYHDPSPRRKKHQITFAQNSFYGNANENEDDANKDAREQAKKAQGDVEFLFSQLQKVQHERDELLERNSSLSAQLSGANAHAKELLNKKKSEEESFRRILQKEKDAFERHKVKVQDSKEEKIELLFDWALSCLENQWDLSGDKDVAHLLLRTAVSDARLRQLMLHMRTPEQLAESGAGEAAAAVIEKHNKKSEKQQQQRTTSSPRRGRTKKRKIHSAGNNNRKSSVSKGRHSDTEDESGGGGGGKRDTHSRSRSRPRANASGDDADDGDRPEVSDSDDEVARGYALIQKISKVVRDIDRATGEGGGGEEGHDDDEGERQGGAGGVERSLAATTGGHGISTNEKKTTKVGNKTTTTKKLKKLKKKRKGAKKGGSKLSSTTGGAATTDDDNDEDDDDDGVNGDDNEDGGGQGCAQPKHGNAQHQQPLHKQYKNSNSSNNNILNNNNNNIINDGISMNSEAKQPTGTKLSSSAAPAVKVTAGSVVVAGGGGGDDDSILAMADMLNEEGGGDGSVHKQQQNSNILQHDSVLSDASKILAGSAAGADGANHGTAATATTSSGGVDDDRTLPFSGDDEMEMKYLSKLLAETRGMAINASQDIGLFQTAIDPNDIYDKTGQAPYSPIRNASVPPVQPIHSATDSETPLSSTYNDLLHQSATGHKSADKNYSDKTISTNTNNNKFGRCGSGTGSDSVVSIPPVIPVDLMMMGDRNAMELEISLQETSVTDEDQRVRSRASSPNGRQIVSGSGSRQQQSYNTQDPFGSTDFTRRNDIKYEYFDDTYLSHETKNIVSGHSKYDDILASGEIEKANTKTSTAAISTSNSSSSAYLGSDTEERQKPNESAYDRYKRELAEAEQLRKKQEAKTALYGDYKQPPNSSSSGVAPVASTDGNSSSSSSSGRNNSSAVPVAAAKGVSVDELVRDILIKVDYMDRSMASSGDAAAKSSRERTTSNDSFDYGQIGALNTAGSTGSAGNNSNSGTTTRVPSTPSTHQNQQYPQNQRQLLPVESTPYTNAGNYGGGAASYTPTINKGNTDISGDNYYSSSHPSSSMLTAAAQSDTALPVTAANTHQSNAAAATTTAVVASASTESSQVYTPFTGTSAPNSVTAAGTKKSVTGTPRGGGGGGTGGDVSAGKSEGGDDYEADFEYSADFEAGSVVTTGSKIKSSTIKSTTAIADTVAAPPVPAAAAAPVPAPVPTSAAAVARVNVPSASASIRSDGLLPGGDLDDDLYNPDFD